jgi:hypothetical protein
LPTTNTAEWGCVTVNEKKYHGIQETRRFSTEITPLTRINVGKKRERLKESLDRLWNFQEVEAPGISKQSAHEVRLSALRTSRLYTQEIFLVLISVRG